MLKVKLGQFVRVGDSIGVIVNIEPSGGDIDEHVGVWYGELADPKTPKYRTVPTEYCEPVDKVESYH